MAVAGIGLGPRTARPLRPGAFSHGVSASGGTGDLAHASADAEADDAAGEVARIGIVPCSVSIRGTGSPSSVETDRGAGVAVVEKTGKAGPSPDCGAAVSIRERDVGAGRDDHNRARSAARDISRDAAEQRLLGSISADVSRC